LPNRRHKRHTETIHVRTVVKDCENFLVGEHVHVPGSKLLEVGQRLVSTKDLWDIKHFFLLLTDLFFPLDFYNVFCFVARVLPTVALIVVLRVQFTLFLTIFQLANPRVCVTVEMTPVEKIRTNHFAHSNRDWERKKDPVEPPLPNLLLFGRINNRIS
ncbi:MAG: hypothetical protein J3R72DRAFT_444962, partial [Linnemannia gamsii]